MIANVMFLGFLILVMVQLLVLFWGFLVIVMV